MNLFKNEKTLPVLVVVASSLLVGVIILYGYNSGKISWLKNRNNKQVTTQTEKEKIKQANYIEVARKTLDWIDKQRSEYKGLIVRGLGCSVNGCEIKNKDDLIITRVRLNFYEKYKDSNDLEMVKKDINKFWEEYSNEDLSDSLWICKTTYEIAQSKYIDQDQKDKLKKLCFNSKEMTVEEKEKYGREHFVSEIKTVLPLMTIKKNIIYSRYMDSYFGQISNLAYKYAWSGENHYKELIEKYFLIDEKLILNNEVRESQNVCLFGLSVLDTWKLVDKSKTKLDYVTNLYKTVETKTINENFWENPICALLVKNLFEATRDVKLFEKIEKNNKKNSDNYSKDQFGGDFTVSDLNKDNFNPVVNLVDRALEIELMK